MLERFFLPDCLNREHYCSEAAEHLVTPDWITIPELDPDSRKGKNGKICIIGGSPLFHGAGQFAALGALEITTLFSSITNDGVYFCSLPEIADYLKAKTGAFMAIKREELDEYIPQNDVIVIGPGMMREPQNGRLETLAEPEITKEMTEKVLASGKKAVLDAGSIQVISPDQLRGKREVIITPHRKEMANLFKLELDSLVTSHHFDFKQVSQVGETVQKIAHNYGGITILLKGPIDIMSNGDEWLFSPGGNAGMSKGGTGDVLAGVVGALYPRIKDPLMSAAAGSYLMKRVGEGLFNQYRDFYNAEDLIEYIGPTFKLLREHLVSLSLFAASQPQLHQ